MELCERVANEKDPEKLMSLIEELDRLLEEKKELLSKTPKIS
jgi:hypothetical protein